MKPKGLLMYISMSGNTEETAELIEGHLSEIFDLKMYRIGRDLPLTKEEFLSYDLFILGSYTWGSGELPIEVKDEIYDLGVKHPLTYIFGTGDTQFGGDALFCKSADRLSKFYDSPIYPLKIEQSPRGSQESKVSEWSQLLIRSFKDIKGF